MSAPLARCPAPANAALKGADQLEALLRASPGLMAALHAARAVALPSWRIVSGAVYQTAWNGLTGRPDMYGIADIDLAYLDPDTSWDAEDQVIRRAEMLMAAEYPNLPPLQVRNQARVHLWYPERFGHAIPRLSSVEDGMRRYAARAHAVGVRLEADGRLDIAAPFGLADILTLRIAPNPALPNAATYAAKAARQRALWPELTIAPWPDAGPAPAPPLPHSRRIE
ncbi:MAG: nucleotidyltransferase family protein [Pseudomonadota bacterium]